MNVFTKCTQVYKMRIQIELSSNISVKGAPYAITKFNLQMPMLLLSHNVQGTNISSVFDKR